LRGRDCRRTLEPVGQEELGIVLRDGCRGDVSDLEDELAVSNELQVKTDVVQADEEGGIMVGRSGIRSRILVGCKKKYFKSEADDSARRTETETVVTEENNPSHRTSCCHGN
jgi:hypothetical protein